MAKRVSTQRGCVTKHTQYILNIYTVRGSNVRALNGIFYVDSQRHFLLEEKGRDDEKKLRQKKKVSSREDPSVPSPDKECFHSAQSASLKVQWEEKKDKASVIRGNLAAKDCTHNG